MVAGILHLIIVLTVEIPRLCGRTLLRSRTMPRQKSTKQSHHGLVVARLARDAGFDTAEHFVSWLLSVMRCAIEAVQQEDREAASAALLVVEF
jgi:hypothetical protein